MTQLGIAFFGFVTTPPCKALQDSAPVRFELGHQDGGVLFMPPVAGQHPQLTEVVEGVLAGRSHQLLGLVWAQLARSADKAKPHFEAAAGLAPSGGADRLSRNAQELHRREAGGMRSLDAIPIHIVAGRSFRRLNRSDFSCRRVGNWVGRRVREHSSG